MQSLQRLVAQHYDSLVEIARKRWFTSHEFRYGSSPYDLFHDTYEAVAKYVEKNRSNIIDRPLTREDVFALFARGYEWRMKRLCRMQYRSDLARGDFKKILRGETSTGQEDYELYEYISNKPWSEIARSMIEGRKVVETMDHLGLNTYSYYKLQRQAKTALEQIR